MMASNCTSMNYNIELFSRIADLSSDDGDGDGDSILLYVFEACWLVRLKGIPCEPLVDLSCRDGRCFLSVFHTILKMKDNALYQNQEQDLEGNESAQSHQMADEQEHKSCILCQSFFVDVSHTYIITIWYNHVCECTAHTH